MALYHSQTWRHVIIRNYLMAFWLSPDVSTPDPIISTRALSHIPFHYFNAFGVKNDSKPEEGVFFALRHATCLHLTSSHVQCYVPGMITSLRSKYMTFGYHHGRLITSWRERAYRICRLWVIKAKCVLNMWLLEIISWRFGYRPKYQPEAPLSDQEL